MTVELSCVGLVRLVRFTVRTRGLGNSPLIGIEMGVKNVLPTTDENENWIREP